MPAAHGGFETFAERLVIWLRDRGWQVTVYCQGSEDGKRFEDEWEGIRRIHIPVRMDGAAGTIEFDVKSASDALKQPGLLLTLGYNTGFLSAWLRTRRRRNAINMDGIEWRRAKYSKGAKAYLWLNERLAAWAGDSLIADHPEIGRHLGQRSSPDKIVMIPYGCDMVEDAGVEYLAPLGLEPGKFLTVIARPEPENSILEIVEAFSRKPRGLKLAVLGKYARDHAYQAKVMDAASDEVLFPGAIYDKPIVNALRFYSLAYVHGHQVGGTNPSLVEALGAGNAVIAHDNPFNRWVAGDAGRYFADADECAARMEELFASDTLAAQMRVAARERARSEFSWPKILSSYEAMLEKEHAAVAN